MGFSFRVPCFLRFWIFMWWLPPLLVNCTVHWEFGAIGMVAMWLRERNEKSYLCRNMMSIPRVMATKRWGNRDLLRDLVTENALVDVRSMLEITVTLKTLTRRRWRMKTVTEAVSWTWTMLYAVFLSNYIHLNERWLDKIYAVHNKLHPCHKIFFVDLNIKHQGF